MRGIPVIAAENKLPILELMELQQIKFTLQNYSVHG